MEEKEEKEEVEEEEEEEEEEERHFDYYNHDELDFTELNLEEYVERIPSTVYANRVENISISQKFLGKPKVLTSAKSSLSDVKNQLHFFKAY
ncbi:hypothetical protein HZH68_006890 [Vespula germanica]|uniref:Uncharacterized protein n=1 Tax=Vespula germanica TaxID=30212 RepID=A0A834N8V7_VESGE|nr:hypothetical protein HZH68_006890 [Vespula germanica]